MQRKQIKVGDVLFHQEPRSWNDNSLWDIARVTVVAIEPHRLNSSRTDYEPGIPGRFGKSTTRDLLVDLEARKNDGSGFHPARRTLVRVADLRGPFDEAMAAAQQRHEAKQTRYHEQVARKQAVRDAVDAAITRARADGISSAVDGTSHHFNDRMEFARVSVSLADFELLVKAAAELRRRSR